MGYYLSKIVQGEFNAVIERVTQALKAEGFGVLTDIDVAATFKKKLDVDFRAYRILGACNPKLAHKALQTDDKIGVLLPCNVIVQQLDDGVEVAAVDPVSSLGAANIPAMAATAEDVKARLARMLEAV